MARVLVLDDDSAVCAMLKAALEEDGHEVEARGDGVAGLAAYRAAPAELVVVDLVMPERDGIETIRDLRRIDPAVKILAISGDQGTLRATTSLDAARKLGADATLPKPFGAAQVRDAVAALLAA